MRDRLCCVSGAPMSAVMVTRRCVHCGKQFHVSIGKTNRKYCDDLCNRAAYKRRVRAKAKAADIAKAMRAYEAKNARLAKLAAHAGAGSRTIDEYDNGPVNGGIDL